MRNKRIFVILLALVFVCGVAFASVGVKEEGTMVGAATDLNFVGAGVTATGDYGSKTITIAPSVVEFHDTTDTTLITAAESGKNWIVTQNTKFQLPTASLGLTYSFTCGGDYEIEIQVETTPSTIKYVSADDATQVDDGSGTILYGVVLETIANTTGTTITLVCDGTDWWPSNVGGTISYLTEPLFGDGGVWLTLDRGAQD